MPLSADRSRLADGLDRCHEAAVLLNTALTDLSDAEARELALDAVAAVARLERRLQLLAEAFRIAESFLAADQFLVSGADTDEQEPVASVLGRPARIGSSD